MYLQTMASKRGSGKVVDIRTRKTVSGENIPEGHRNTEAVKVRLDPAVAKNLKSIAAFLGVTVSDYVEASFSAMQIACGGPTPPMHGAYARVLEAAKAKKEGRG